MYGAVLVRGVSYKSLHKPEREGERETDRESNLKSWKVRLLRSVRFHEFWSRLALTRFGYPSGKQKEREVEPEENKGKKNGGEDMIASKAAGEREKEA